tara:strand:- start:53738 stop:54280 length:543 start_codon:yes stop_codon:yes gene_type:complete
MQIFKSNDNKPLSTKNGSASLILILLSFVTLVTSRSQAGTFTIPIFQDALTCSDQLVTTSDLSFENLNAYFSISNGSLYKLEFKINPMRIVSADLIYPQTFSGAYDTARGLTLYSCSSQKTHKKYFLAHGKRNMGLNIYKYDLFVLLPITKQTPLVDRVQTLVDLRKGSWQPALMSTSKK